MRQDFTGNLPFSPAAVAFRFAVAHMDDVFHDLPETDFSASPGMYPSYALPQTVCGRMMGKRTFRKPVEPVFGRGAGDVSCKQTEKL
jgi:hypothetical protein